MSILIDVVWMTAITLATMPVVYGILYVITISLFPIEKSISKAIWASQKRNDVKHTEKSFWASKYGVHHR